MTNDLLRRREFIQFSVSGIALSSSSTAARASNAVPLPQTSDNIKDIVTTQTDVLVVGGGTAGTIAAIQAGRAGTKTFLIERGTQLAVRRQQVVYLFRDFLMHGESKS